MGVSIVIPGWKVKRELGRVLTQIRNIPLRLIEPIQRKIYDRRRWELIQQGKGDVALKQKVCIFLLYQPKALAGSVLETCEFLAKKGYSILIVANGGLQAESVELLKSSVWFFLERPNFGYDFGGFQDGIKFLNHEKISPESLIILNDSIWFPLSQESRVLEDLQDSVFDVTGLLLHSPARNDTPALLKAEEEHRRFKLRRRLAEHIESYLICVRKEIFAGRIFQEFWENYTPSSSKYLTIKRGEIGFSKAMTAGGLSVGALSRRADFARLIETQSDEFIHNTLRYAAYSDDDLQIERNRLLEAAIDGGWRVAAISHIRRTIERRRFNASFCWATEQFFATSFIKKNDGMLFRRSRIRYLEAVQDGLLPLPSVAILAEIKATQDQGLYIPERHTP